MRRCVGDMLSSSRRASSAAALACIVVAGVCVAAACAPPPLAHAHASADELAREVLRAFEQRDVTRLRDLAISAEEFERHVWPALPAARPERNLPLHYVWGDLHQKSEAHLRRTLSEHGGRRYELQAVRFAAPAASYAGYRVHRRTELLVRDAAGRRRKLRIMGSMLESARGWKVFSYVADAD